MTCFNISLSKLSQKTDVTAKLVEDVLHRTKEYLQPNPGEE
jgi:hypothetical protein